MRKKKIRIVVDLFNHLFYIRLLDYSSSYFVSEEMGIESEWWCSSNQWSEVSGMLSSSY
jgi:hypothetical protein